MMKYIGMVVFAGWLLAGCNNIAEQTTKTLSDSEPVVAIAPGYKVIIDGKPTAIFGSDECPTKGTSWVQFYFREDRFTCILLRKDRAQVSVRFDQGRGIQEEHWTVVRGTWEKYGLTFPNIGLRRPDGSMIVTAESS